MGWDVRDLNDDMDGCGINFVPHAMKDEDREALLVPEGEEEDEEDA